MFYILCIVKNLIFFTQKLVINIIIGILIIIALTVQSAYS